MTDRAEINRALAKAIAYKECGKPAAMRDWARTLIHLLECEDILTPEDLSTAAARSTHAA